MQRWVTQPSCVVTQRFLVLRYIKLSGFAFVMVSKTICSLKSNRLVIVVCGLIIADYYDGK